MIYKEEYTGDLHDKNAKEFNIYYYGDDVKNIPSNELSDDWKQDVINYINKQCITDEGEEGIIIGFEINKQYFDYYYRVYIHKINKVKSILANNAKFTKTIK